MNCIYDIFWLLFKFNGYFLSKQNYEYTTLSRISYVFSFLNLICKLLLAGSLYIQVQKSEIKKNNLMIGRGRNSHNLPRGSIRIV